MFEVTGRLKIREGRLDGLSAAGRFERLGGHVTFNRYSVLQGLDTDIQALHEVPA